nr:hypothetical protein [uncultured Pseudodesulfovibrio sp.]
MISSVAPQVGMRRITVFDVEGRFIWSAGILMIMSLAGSFKPDHMDTVYSFR